MLPIRYRHYNPLTRQFEDECENHFNLLPTTPYPNFVSETNENDVEIAKYKYNTAIQLAKMNYEHNVEIAEIHSETEIVKALCQVHIAQNNRRTIKKNRNPGLFSFLFSEKDDIIIESERW